MSKKYRNKKNLFIREKREEKKQNMYIVLMNRNKLNHSFK